MATHGGGLSAQTDRDPDPIDSLPHHKSPLLGRTTVEGPINPPPSKVLFSECSPDLQPPSGTTKADPTGSSPASSLVSARRLDTPPPGGGRYERPWQKLNDPISWMGC